MTVAVWVFLTTASAAAVVCWVAASRRHSNVQLALTPVVTALLLGAALVAHYQRPHVRPWLTLALTCYLAGDLVRMAIWWSRLRAVHAVAAEVAAAAKASRADDGGPTSRQSTSTPAALDVVPRRRLAVLPGLTLLLLGVLSYDAAIIRFGVDLQSSLFGLALVLTLGLAVVSRMVAGARRIGGHPMTVVVVVSMAVLGSAVVLGVGSGSLAIGYGSVLFAAAKLVSGYDGFVKVRSWTPLAAGFAVQVAQGVLLVGLVT